MAKTPKNAAGTTKKPKAQKEVKATPAAAASNPVVFNSPVDEENQKLFHHHLPIIESLREKVATATANLRNAYKTAKGDGAFTKADFDTAIQIKDAEREAKTKARIARQLVIARYMGKALGAQLEMFLEPDRTPASDLAFEEGRIANLQKGEARPPYDPSTEQYRRWMEGFHSVNEVNAKGIKPLHPEVQADQEAAETQKQANDAQRAADAEVFEEQAPPVTSGVPMSRAEFIARQQAGGSAFARKS